MRSLKQLIIILSIGTFIWACGSYPTQKGIAKKEEPVVIANDSLEYEIIIIDPGFNFFLDTRAQPKGYYNQQYLENRNYLFVTNWNIRASNPTQYNNNIYENIIDYQPNIDYGYDVNYKLFNYFMFAQRKYKINLGTVSTVRTR